MLLALIPRQQGLRWQRALVECVGGEDEPTVRGDQRLMGCERGSQGPGEMVRDLGRRGVLARAAPPAIARPRRDGPRVPRRGLPAVEEGGEGVLGLSGTGRGGAAARRKGLLRPRVA
jgi:hypothetical protein